MLFLLLSFLFLLPQTVRTKCWCCSRVAVARESTPVRSVLLSHAADNYTPLSKTRQLITNSLSPEPLFDLTVLIHWSPCLAIETTASLLGTQTILLLYVKWYCLDLLICESRNVWKFDLTQLGWIWEICTIGGQCELNNTITRMNIGKVRFCWTTDELKLYSPSCCNLTFV